MRVNLKTDSKQCVSEVQLQDSDERNREREKGKHTHTHTREQEVCLLHTVSIRSHNGRLFCSISNARPHFPLDQINP